MDPGSDVNLIKIKSLVLELKYEPNKAVLLTGINPDPVETIGTINITLFDIPVEFQYYECSTI